MQTTIKVRTVFFVIAFACSLLIPAMMTGGTAHASAGTGEATCDENKEGC